MKGFNGLNIGKRILIFVTVLVFVLGISNVFIQYFTTRDLVHSEKRQMLKATVGVAYSVLENWHKRYSAGEMSEDDAKKGAMLEIRALRYGPERADYFWINDVDTRMVMHPYKPELDGKDLRGMKDPDGKNLFVEMVKVATGHQREGFVKYRWQWKNDVTKIYPKISFVKNFASWGWIIGSGIYVNEVDGVVFNSIKFTIVAGIFLFFIAIVVVILFGKKIDGVIRKLFDEVGSLAVAAEEGRLNIRIVVENIHHGLRPMVVEINRIIDNLLGPIKETSKVLEKMAQNDLTVRVTGEYHGEMKDFKDNINKAVENLEDSMSNVKAAVLKIENSSSESSKASQELSQGASEQASSLEEMTSSMNEIGNQTKHNAENASQAKSLSDESKKSANKGDEQMKMMVDAMTDIGQSSQNISKIIKVIDEIAFQTNLLALNAAVEAARAGKHGKGFAVVAEEVRNLAARSAKAAKETTELIEDSVKKVENGSKIVKNTSNALEEIVQVSTKVSELVDEIASASNDQAQGVSQITIALGQIDKVTQRNMTNAEESASVAEELSSQAIHLDGMVSQFILSLGEESTNESEKGLHLVAESDDFSDEIKDDDSFVETKDDGRKSFKIKTEKEALWGEEGKEPEIILDDKEFGKY
ncbi:MAG: cache domain-containing protein [Bacteriovoracaceae bacterium]|nr:cache domain-containing protein [Bacteriovoracaceae bacterium]